MTLQNTALQELPEGGDEWQLANPTQETPNALQQQEPQTEEPVENVQQPEAPRLSTVEEVALELGWTPQDRWRGDPNKWTPASEYLRTTGRVLERTKTELKQYKTTAQSLEQRLAALEGEHLTARQREAQNLNGQYEEAKFNAAKAGNEELYAKLVKEQAEVMAQFKPSDRPQQPQQPQGPQVDVYEQAERIMQDPVAARFFEANPIALNDERAWELMDREMTIVAQRGGTPAQQFKAAEEALRYAYADAYQAPGQPHHSQTQPREQGRFASPQQQQAPRRPAPPMAPATRTVTQQAQTAVDRLPAEAKAHLEREAAAGKVTDKEQWAKAFLGEKVVVRGRAPNEQRQGS